MDVREYRSSMPHVYLCLHIKWTSLYGIHTLPLYLLLLLLYCVLMPILSRRLWPFKLLNEKKIINLSDTNSRCMFPLSFYLKKKKNYLQILDIKTYDCDNILSPFWSSRGLVVYQLRKAYLDFHGWGAWTFLQIW